jgi:precorrin-4/cobalt-precorrin-4 C11-methyltransferase
MKASAKGRASGECTVYFVGAGPGDPDLLTIKGRRLLEGADVIIYAGSLVNRRLLRGLKGRIHDSAKMTLDEIIAVMKDAVEAGKRVVRLHTGDTSLYSAVTEQIERLSELGIRFEVVPGVSSAMAGAAALGRELTIPGISQTVIFTRLEGRTPVPKRERLSGLAKHRASMVIFLSIGMIDMVVEELMKGYQMNTPVVVIEKASWPEQKIVKGTLQNIAGQVREAGIKKTALIYIGESLRVSEKPLGMASRLYSSDFTHGYRK